MSTLTVPPLIVLIPLLILGAWIGLQRGWKNEAWTAAILMLMLLVISQPESMLLPTLERLISAFQRAGQALLGQDSSGPAFQFEDNTRPVAQFFAFLLFVALAYSVGQLLGKGEKSKGLWSMLAALLGAFNLLLTLGWLANNFLFDRTADGSIRLTIPSFDGAQVVLGTSASTALLNSWQGWLSIIMVVILFFFLISRARGKSKST